MPRGLMFVSTSQNILRDVWLFDLGEFRMRFSSCIQLHVAEVEVDVVTKLEAEGVEVVLHHVWAEAEDCGR
jgi:hypothetical protein